MIYTLNHELRDQKKAKTLNALGKAEEKRLQGLLEKIQTKHDNRYGQPYSPIDKTPIGKPLTASPVISKSNTEKNNIDKKVSSVTPNTKPGVEFLNMDLGTEREVDVADDIDPSGGEVNAVEVVNSINSLNDYMTKTPKIHQIIG